LLSSEFFLELINDMTTYNMSAMVACRPGVKADADALAYHHTLQHALTEIVGQLKSYVLAGEQQAAVNAAINDKDFE
jgi:hypothetical protein